MTQGGIILDPGDEKRSKGGLILGGEASYRRRAKSHPLVRYKHLVAEFDEYDDGGVRVLHTICPRCTRYGLIDRANKRFDIDEDGLLTIEEPFRCDYCKARFAVTDGVMSDV
jgi:hypothetical protein